MDRWLCFCFYFIFIFVFLIILIPPKAQQTIRKLIKEQKTTTTTPTEKKSMIGNYGQRIASLRQMVNQITVTFMSNEKAFFFVCPALSVSVIYYRSGIYSNGLHKHTKPIDIHIFTHLHIFTAYQIPYTYLPRSLL